LITTFSSLDSDAGTSAETTGDARLFGTNGVIAAGRGYDTLTSFGTSASIRRAAPSAASATTSWA
jgi:hypothetical protein